MNAPSHPRIQRFRTQEQIAAERDQPNIVVLVPTSDREASRAFVDAVFGPKPEPKPVVPPLAEQVAGLQAEIHKHPALQRIYGSRAELNGVIRDIVGSQTIRDFFARPTEKGVRS